VTLRLNQQAEELVLSQDYQRKIRSEFAQMSAKTDSQVDGLTESNKAKNEAVL